MMAISTIMRRELNGFFATPVAYVFIGIFLILSGVATFSFGQLYERHQADLFPFFQFHPWLYLFLVPAISMRSWSEELRSGSIELLMTLPLSTLQIVVGKFLAAWLVLAVALALTFPLWLTVNYLGDPDNGVIVAAYLGSWLMSGAFLAISLCLSTVSRSQAVAFISAMIVCFVFVLIGSEFITSTFTGWLPVWLIDALASLSLVTHFQSMAKGVLALNDVSYFIIVMATWLYAGLLIVEQKRAS